MNNYEEKNDFGFERDNNQELGYDGISGLGESDYENEDLFSVEVDNNSESTLPQQESIVSQNEDLGYNLEFPIDYEIPNLKMDYNSQDGSYSENQPDNFAAEKNASESENVEKEEKKETYSEKQIDNEFLDNDNEFKNNSIENDYELPVVQPNSNIEVNILSDTPIEELTKLTEYNEEKIQTTDIKALFDRVGVNVKEASDIFKKNTEMKEKIDSRFEELKILQAEVEKTKKAQYDEINSYKEEVFSKLTEKKEEIEKRLNKLREFQTSLEKEKQEFEQYKKTEKEEIERVQREVQDAYDSRREELSHIEDVLRKQKDALDEERSQLSLDIIQYESDKNELANNLLKFNEIVDSFTNGMDKLNKEEE